MRALALLPRPAVLVTSVESSAEEARASVRRLSSKASLEGLPHASPVPYLRIAPPHLLMPLFPNARSGLVALMVYSASGKRRSLDDGRRLPVWEYE